MPALSIKNLPYRNGTYYFQRIRHMDWPVLLDSGFPDSPSGRFDIISASPCEKVHLEQRSHSNALESLQTIIQRHSPSEITETSLPFTGGFIGGLSYDLGRQLETLPENATKDRGLPAIIGGIYTWAVITDHQMQQSWLIASDDATDHLYPLLSETPSEFPESQTDSLFRIRAPFVSHISREKYIQQFERIIEYIRAGDCYQINFAQRFSAIAEGDCWQAYLKMRKATPAPFSAYLDFDDFKILSVSPERFLKLDHQQVETKPIKGTAPRSADATEDLRIADELSHSIKNRAENLMIVDLLRNDLSRICQPGSVHVPHLFALESYANVHHLVSTVTGTLAPEENAATLLKASFPGGSITGAPKIRAMEIIDELEPHQRNIYCGSVAWIDFRGHMDSSITIRTMLASRQDAQWQLDCWGGGGIVYDSEADSEYQETLHKVGKIISALQPDFLTQIQSSSAPAEYKSSSCGS